MSQIDYFLHFADEPTAKTALTTWVHKNEQNQDIWDLSTIVPGLQVWRASQDVAGVDSLGNPIVTHTFLTGFYIMVSLPILLLAALNLAAVQLVIDRDKANARQAGMILKSNVSGAILLDIRFSPVLMGANYPFGGFQ